jgi:hypothetical protein
MKNLKTHLIYLLLFVSLNYISAQTLDLQTIPSDKMQFGFNFNKEFFSNNSIGVSNLSGVYQLNFNIPISSDLNIIGDIPYVITNYEFNLGFFGVYRYSENGFGNVFIGLQTKPELVENEKSIFTFGLFLPTASKEASFDGLTADSYYFPKYYPNAFSLYFNYAYHQINSEGLNYGLELGPNVLIPTKENNSGAEFFIHYGLMGGYQINRLLLSLEFVGYGILSEEVENFGDRFINMVNIGAQWKDATVTPTIYYKIYLRDEIRHNIDGVLGIGVMVSI